MSMSKKKRRDCQKEEKVKNKEEEENIQIEEKGSRMTKKKASRIPTINQHP